MMNPNARLGLVCLCWSALLAPTALAQQSAPAAPEATPPAAKADNATCPICKAKVNPSLPTMTIKGKTIGFGCKGCDAKLAGKDPSEQAALIEAALNRTAPTSAPKGPTVAAEPGGRIGGPYPLATCPVSGKPLDVMGDPIVRVYDGREVRFCCEKCVPKFEADQANYQKKIDAQIIRQQKPSYPLATCVVSGEVLGNPEIGDPIDFVYGDRLVRLCCKRCKSDFMADPGRYLKKLDTAIRVAQGPGYPLTTCPVSKMGLESGAAMGGPIDRIYANRLVRFCCKKCLGKFEKDPAGFLAMLDAARIEGGSAQMGGMTMPADDGASHGGQ